MSKLNEMLVKPTVLTLNCAPWVPIAAAVFHPLVPTICHALFPEPLLFVSVPGTLSMLDASGPVAPEVGNGAGAVLPIPTLEALPDPKDGAGAKLAVPEVRLSKVHAVITLWAEAWGSAPTIREPTTSARFSLKRFMGDFIWMVRAPSNLDAITIPFWAERLQSIYRYFWISTMLRVDDDAIVAHEAEIAVAGKFSTHGGPSRRDPGPSVGALDFVRHAVPMKPFLIAGARLISLHER